MGEQRGFAPLLTVDLASVTVELNLCESGARFPCKWSSVLEIYNKTFPRIEALFWPGLEGYVTALTGRALDWQSRGQRFDPAYLHQSL